MSKSQTHGSLMKRAYGLRKQGLSFAAIEIKLRLKQTRGMKAHRLVKAAEKVLGRLPAPLSTLSKQRATAIRNLDSLVKTRRAEVIRQIRKIVQAAVDDLDALSAAEDSQFKGRK